MADGKIIIDTHVDGSGAEKGLKGLNSKLGSLVKTGVSTITGLVAGATAAIGALGAVGIKFNSDMENYLTNFEVMLGSAEAAVKHVDDLKKFAAKTPFEIGDLANASKLMLQFGADVDDIMPNLQMLGDISLGNGEKFQSLALVFSQVQSQGKLMGNDLLQLINAGFNPLQIISEQTGESMASLKEKMSDGQISFEMVAEAMKVATSEGGRFYEGMEKQSQTMSGLFSTLKDNAMSLIGDVFKPVSDTIKNTILPAALGYVDELQKAFESDGLSGIVSKFGEIGGEIISSLAASLPKMVDMGVNMISSLITGIKNNLPAIATGAIDIVMSLVNGIIEMLPMILNVGLQALITLSEGIAANLPTLIPAIFDLVNSMYNMLIENLPLLLEAGKKGLIALGQGISENLPTLIPTIVNLLISMCDMIIASLPLILDVAIDIIMALVQGLITALPTLIAEVPRIINSFADAIYGALPTILKAGIEILMMLIKGLIDSIPTLIANIPQIIMAIVNAVTLYNWAGLGKNLINWLSNGISSMKGNIGNIAKGVAEWVGTSITNIFKGGLSWGKNLISSIGQGFSSMMSFLGSSASSIATNALNSIINAFKGGFNIGKDLIKGIWNGISSMGDWILNLIGGFAGNIIDGIKSFFKIKSPSRVMRDEVGKYLAQGVGVGFEEETPSLEKSIQGDLSDLTAKMQATVDHETAMTSARIASGNPRINSTTVTNNNENGVTQNVTIVNPERTPSENARALKKVGRELAFG
ncbi:MAG: tape measure protein [Clostridium sp.]